MNAPYLSAESIVRDLAAFAFWIGGCYTCAAVMEKIVMQVPTRFPRRIRTKPDQWSG
jgi:hypothetical protein